MRHKPGVFLLQHLFYGDGRNVFHRPRPRNMFASDGEYRKWNSDNADKIITTNQFVNHSAVPFFKIEHAVNRMEQFNREEMIRCHMVKAFESFGFSTEPLIIEPILCCLFDYDMQRRFESCMWSIVENHGIDSFRERSIRAYTRVHFHLVRGCIMYDTHRPDSPWRDLKRYGDSILLSGSHQNMYKAAAAHNIIVSVKKHDATHYLVTRRPPDQATRYDWHRLRKPGDMITACDVRNANNLYVLARAQGMRISLTCVGDNKYEIMRIAQ